MRASRPFHTTAAASATVLGATLVLAAGASTRAEPEGLAAYLSSSFGFGTSDVARAARGQVVARTLPAPEDREVVTAGVVRVRATPEFYVQRIEDIVNFKKSDAVLQIGQFSTPPRLDDVEALTLDASDIESLRECRVGRCGLQLTGDAIGRFKAIDWRARNAAAEANRVMREVLVDHVREYLAAGSADMHYADKGSPFSVHQVFATLVETGDGGWHLFPTLRRHLTRFPHERSARADDLVYWSKEQVGRKTVVSVTHLATERLGSESPADYAVASRQIYGSHYFDASLGLTVLVSDAAGPAPGTYVVYVNRSRIDMFGGLFGGVVKRVVTSRARSTVATELERMRASLEHEFQNH
jgi:hypothetical protein